MKITAKFSIVLVLVVTVLLIGSLAWKWLGSNVMRNRSSILPVQVNQGKIAGDSATEKVKPTPRNGVSTMNTKDALSQDVSLSKEKDVPSVVRASISYDDLPEPFTEEEFALILSKLEAEKIWKAQDRIMMTWPAYKDCEERLRQELAQELNIDDASEEKLLCGALKFRENFWQMGGNSSSKSYQHIYKARLLLELAHSRNPENLVIIDELVESIQAASPVGMYDSKTNKMVRNNDLGETLLKLRSEQFDQIKKEIVQADREPTWQDFICAIDFAVLLSIHDNALAKNVVDWIQKESVRGDWTAYSGALRDFQDALHQGRKFCFALYAATNDRPEDILTYGRRYPSFRGPNPEKRGVVLWGKDYANGYSY